MQFTARSLLVLLPVLTSAIDTTRDPALDASLLTAATQLDRLNLLPSDSSWSFDYTQQPTYTFAPGAVINANAATFPASVENELTMAMINLGPCSMLPPHYHPRAANYVVAVSGNTTTYMIEENGARVVTEILTPGKMTIFPRGSAHAMQNTGCTNAQLVSALSNTDAGTHNIANALFQMPQSILNAAFGNPKNGVKVNAANIPAPGTGAIYGDDACLAACGLATHDASS